MATNKTVFFLIGILLIVLGVVNIIYAALTSFAQRNLKRKIAYSSISHMGFVLIGIGSFSSLEQVELCFKWLVMD